MESGQQQGTPIRDIGEFGLIGQMRGVLGESADEAVVEGISDDAAVYRTGGDKVHVATTDALLEGVHFDRSFMPMGHLGAKSMAVNVSDIVAMNAEPRFALVTLGIPKGLMVEQVTALYNGLKQACDAYGVTIIGGDTVGAPRLTISITVIGEAAEEDIIYRRGAQVGDALCVTGDVGAAYAGLKILLQQRQALEEKGDSFKPDLDEHNYVIQRQLTPRPRLDVIRDWRERKVRPHALIDISDGLSSEIHHISEASGVGARVFGAALPVALETRNVADLFQEGVDVFALFGGEDYELVFTLPQNEVDQLDDQSFSVIGEITKEQDVVIQMPEGETVGLKPGGFDHFEEE